MSEPTITEPCVVAGMTDAVYHADPVAGGSLSSTGARTVLKSPARFQWDLAHRVEKTVYDVGHAAHAKILGIGSSVIEYPAEHLTPSGNVSTKGATVLWASEQRAAGLVPVTPGQITDVDAMAEAVLAYLPAREILERPGQSEVSLFAPDPETGVWLRARIDRLDDEGPGETVASDLKTTTDADPEEFSRDVATYGYDVQQAHYELALRLARGDEEIAFQFICVEKTAPHLVSVCALDSEFEEIGRRRARRAIDTYARCVESGDWPGYEPRVHYLDAPRWLACEEGMGL
jgi:hypothetical protein